MRLLLATEFRILRLNNAKKKFTTFVPSKKVLWPSGQAELCKSFHSGSNPLGTSFYMSLLLFVFYC